MKSRVIGIFLVGAMFGVAQIANAAPERIAIKTPDQQVKTRMAESQIKAIDLQDIEDPAARRAIQEILNYLGLESQSIAVSK